MDNVKSSTSSDIFHTTRNGISALGIYDGEKFQVLEGSQININKPVHLASTTAIALLSINNK